ncbi:hypothetical protein ACUNV4_18460 [Granulosicoccus sp. 3-233]|uniref:hypothetical protein n=1 Tax=Granulosicoccus sp. 3-233 TaxID=3417969 RepID=UPI003D32F54D
MSDRPDDLKNLLMQRIELVSSLSEATANHMRLLQKSSGIDVLLLKRDSSAGSQLARQEADDNMASSQAAIDSLEARLAVIDRQIESNNNKEA